MSELDWTTFSEDVLRNEAEAWKDAIYCEDDEGYCDPEKASWVFVAEFPVGDFEHLMEGGADAWKRWFAAEHEMLKDDGREWVCQDMLDRDIVEPVIVLCRDDKPYIWDGWHRVGSCFATGRETIRAIVGTPHPVRKPKFGRV